MYYKILCIYTNAVHIDGKIMELFLNMWSNPKYSEYYPGLV